MIKMDLGKGTVSGMQLEGLSKANDVFLIRFPNSPLSLEGIRFLGIALAPCNTMLGSNVYPQV